MKEELPGYCEHFEYLKAAQSLRVEREAACKCCFHALNLWVCLSKNCGVVVCARNDHEHMAAHLEESRRSKKFHSVFVNPATAEIRCVQCQLQIGDLDLDPALRSKQDPFPLRLRLLPALASLTAHRIVGQLENSEGHRKLSRGLVGIFSDKYNHSLNAAVQFLAHVPFLTALLLQCRLSENSKILRALRELVVLIESGQYRAVHSDAISQLLYQESPALLGYRRKDPFETILLLLGLLDDETVSYAAVSGREQGCDEWDVFYRKGALTAQHLVYSAIEATLSLNYECSKCKTHTSQPHNVQFLKLSIPKRKRRAREVEKELASHRCDSPTKTRRRSLVNLFKEQECPLSVAELLIELTKSPLHRDLACPSCGNNYKKTKLHFQKLPEVLIIQIARFSREGGVADETEVALSTDSLDLGSFTATPDEQVWYDFETAVCLQGSCLFPLVVVAAHNKQKYVIRHETVELCKTSMNPYILCYRRRPSETAKQKMIQIDDDLKSKRERLYRLPDFWYTQLQFGIQRPFRNQLVCKHNALKPQVQSHELQPTLVSEDVYEDLLNFYQPDHEGGSRIRPRNGSPLQPSQKANCYFNQTCQICLEQMQQLNDRRRKEKQSVLMYDKLRSESLPYCMISSAWIKKWSNYLYNKELFGYMHKGYPMPPPIDNKPLLDGNKCKPNLIKNEDYKILNICLWKFLKELYGGGPEIRYKWKEGSDRIEQELIGEIRARANELKYIYSSPLNDSPKKLGTSLSFIQRENSFSESKESSERSHLEPIAEGSP